MKIFLASASPRRKELLSQLIPNFEVISCDVEELHDADISTELLVEKNALRKVMCAFNQLRLDQLLIISADTVIKTSDGVLLGKPKDYQEAISFLQMLSGKSHFVCSGVGILLQRHTQRFLELFSETSKLVFNSLSKSQIESYVTTFKPLDKAGAYGIQELPQGFLKSLEGSMNNVIGLPTEKLRVVLSPYLSYIRE
ncbi:MAG TPA: Maf family protein [Caldisericia bacterium]|nr:Maf family protein [Caldisericia bacterium]